MPICPQCKKDVRRKDGACPECGTELAIYNGRYYRTEDGNPAQAVLKHFEYLVSRQASKNQNMPVVFHISKKTARYKRELVEAERIIEICEGDLEIAKLTLWVLFNNDQMSYKTRTSLIGVAADFELGLAIARGIKAKKEAEVQKANAAFQQVMNKEDIFN